MLAGPFSQSLPKFVITKIGRRRGATADARDHFHQNRRKRAHLSLLRARVFVAWNVPAGNCKIAHPASITFSP
jgi:hypothetical protein